MVSTDNLPDIDSLWNYPKADETEVRFRELLPRAEASGDRAYFAELLTQLARTQSLQRRYDECHALLDQAEALLTPDSHRARVRCLLERGRAFRDTAQYDRAKALFLDAWETAKAHRIDRLAVDAAHMLGVLDPPDEALRWNETAIAYAQASDDPAARRWLGTLLNNVGWIYHDLGQFDRALALFEQCRAYWEERGDNAERHRIACWSVARILRLQGRADEALAVQRELLAEAVVDGASDGYMSEEIAECLLALGRADEARPLFARAYEVLSRDPWVRDDARLKRLKTLGLADPQ